MTAIRVQAEDFDPAAELAVLTASGGKSGALASFVGLVRADGGLTAMTIEHYPGMTEREIEIHAAEACERWPLLDLRVVHRIGMLTPGERIVFVGASAAHREAAFRAVEFLIDYLKTRAPFWKQEERAGQKTWVDAKETDEKAVSRWR